MGDGPSQVTELNQTPNAVTSEDCSETAGDKLRCREGNSPDLPLRPLKRDLVSKDVSVQGQPGCWLRSSHHLKSA